MSDQEFKINYKQVGTTLINIDKIVNDLLDQNNQLRAEAERLSRCTGDAKNPHNHNSEIAALIAQITQNENWIKQLNNLSDDISKLSDLAHAIDQNLVLYLEKMINDKNTVKYSNDIADDKEKIKYLENQISNAKNNPYMPQEQIDAMRREMQKYQNDIDLKTCYLKTIDNDNKIIEAQNSLLCRKILPLKKKLQMRGLMSFLMEFQKLIVLLILWRIMGR